MSFSHSRRITLRPHRRRHHRHHRHHHHHNHRHRRRPTPPTTSTNNPAPDEKIARNNHEPTPPSPTCKKKQNETNYKGRRFLPLPRGMVLPGSRDNAGCSLRSNEKGEQGPSLPRGPGPCGGRRRRRRACLSGAGCRRRAGGKVSLSIRVVLCLFGVFACQSCACLVSLRVRDVQWIREMFLHFSSSRSLSVVRRALFLVFFPLSRSAAGWAGLGWAGCVSLADLDRFLEAKAGATVLLSESRDLVQFVDMNMHGFR